MPQDQPNYKDNIGPRGRLLHPPAVRARGTTPVGPPDRPPADWTAALTVLPGRLACSAGDFAAAWAKRPAPTPNPAGAALPPVRRRQCTWGTTSYGFGNQVSELAGPMDAAPDIVQRAVAETIRVAPQFNVDPAGIEWFAHVNFYDTGASLQAHQDDETIHGTRVNPVTQETVPGPIFSWTFIQPPPGHPELDYRYFVVQQGRGDVKAPERAARTWPVPLRSGDLAVMDGTFQADVWHGVPSAPTAAKWAGQLRINVTVRALARPYEPLLFEPPSKRTRTGDIIGQTFAEKARADEMWEGFFCRN